MSIKKYTNGSWTPASRKYGTETDTITTLPTTVIGDGTPISSYTIKGNMEQSDTPTPSSPIYPSECGERTENLYNKDAKDTSNGYKAGYYIDSSGVTIRDSVWDVTEYIPCVQQNIYRFYNCVGIAAAICWYDRNKNFISGTSVNSPSGFRTKTITSPANASYVRTCVLLEDVKAGSLVYDKNVDVFMITLDSTAPTSYIPYGYKLPLTLGSTTTDIYLGEVQSTRKIKKLVLTGEESWRLNLSYYQYSFDLSSNPKSRNSLSISSHFYIDERLNVSTYRFGGSQQNPEAILLINYDGGVGGVDAFKQFLATQYAAGTPVTVWYVLANPTTGILNEPLRKIGDYVDSVSGTGLATSGTAQELNIETTLKPSEVDMTYHGWHEHDDTKYST